MLVKYYIWAKSFALTCYPETDQLADTASQVDAEAWLVIDPTCSNI